MNPGIDNLLDRQDGMITRGQALAFMTEDEVAHRLGRTWQVVLPGVYATFTGRISDRQRLRAGLLGSGPDSLLNDLSALVMQKIPYLPADPMVRTMIPDSQHRASRQFLVIKRSTRCPRPMLVDGLPLVPVHRALCEFAARHGDERASLAVIAAAVQRGRVSLQQIIDETEAGQARGRPRLLRIIAALQNGIRSAPEDDFRRLVLSSNVLPEPKWNWLIQLPDGTKISPDGLWLEAALIHEVNGREYHAPVDAGEDAFEDMQRRHDLLTTFGFTALHNSPRRIDTEGRDVLRELTTCYARNLGKGLPPGVVILRAGPPGFPSNDALHGLSA